jgi:hypothetical protein
MKVRIEKAASVTVNVPLEKEVSLRGSLQPLRGTVCIVKALEEKRVYDRIELVSGRMAKVSRGDVIAGALGERRALQGFAGVIPQRIKKGDILNILNIGGVIGKAVSYNREYGMPLKVELLGTVLKDDKTLNISDNALPTATSLQLKGEMPLIVVSGTSMNSGKTEVASKITQELTWKGFRICSVKVSGISALKDMLNMEDHGAVKAVSFLDFGYPSTVHCDDVSLIAKGAINVLAGYDPDLVVVELGDGLLGDYGVLGFFKDSEIQGRINCNIVCALDPVGAWGISEIMSRHQIPIHLVSGPVTDNLVGTEFVRNHLHLEGLNALYQQDELGKYIMKMIERGN